MQRLDSVGIRVLKDYEYAYQIHQTIPSIVKHLLWLPPVLQRLREDPALFAHLILGWKPTPYQVEILRCKDLWQTIRVARQGGKTTGIIGVKALWFLCMFKGLNTLIVSPSMRQSYIARDKMERHIQRIPRNLRKIFFRRVQRTRILSNAGSNIYFLPNSPDLIRGFTAHVIFCDEVAMFRDAEYLIEEVLTPMTNRTRLEGYGYIICTSTPKGKNSFFWEICKGRKSSQWRQFHYTWVDLVEAGLADQRLIDQLRATWLPSKFKTEYEAVFVEDVDTWLPVEMIVNCQPKNPEKREFEYLPSHKVQHGEFYGGVDLGKQRDPSAIIIVRKEENRWNLVHKKRFELGTPYASVIGYMKNLQDLWHIRAWRVDMTGVGQYPVEDMINVGLPVEGVNFTQPRETELATNMKEIMRLRQLEIPYDPDLIEELNSVRYEYTKSGKLKFSHPSGTRDDLFWALALALGTAKKEERSGKSDAFVFK